MHPTQVENRSNLTDWMIVRHRLICSSRVGKILWQYSDWFEDESLSIKERMHAGDRLQTNDVREPRGW
jgi:hypothetical protein